MTEPDLRARSPWSALSDVPALKVSPASGPVRGAFVVPGSKSFTNRALLIAAMAAGRSDISGMLRSDDSYWCLEAIRTLGCAVTVESDAVTIEGCGGQWPNPTAELYIGAAGTTARFLPGLLAASPAGTYLVEGSHRLSERPMNTLVGALRALGANIEYRGTDGFLPIAIRSTGLQGGPVEMTGSVSSQFISGVLMASAMALAPVRLNIVDHVVQHAYVQITLDLMRRFGAVVDASPGLDSIVVQPSPYRGQTVQLEADASTACYFLALAAVTGGDVTIQNLGFGTNQPDIYLLNVLEQMGCTVERGAGHVRCIGAGQLKGGFTVSMKEMSDQALTIAAIAPFADGPVTITEVAHIRHHESDRIVAARDALMQTGITVEEHADGWTIYPGTPRPAVIDSHDDHRVAMSFALLGARVPGIVIANPGCVSKTCPTFFQLLQSTGVSVDYLK